MNDTESEEWKLKKEKSNEIKMNLNKARQNAAKDIFERINSQGIDFFFILSKSFLIKSKYLYIYKGQMGYVNDDVMNSFVKIDLHSLFVAEAKIILNEYVLPVLPALKKMIIITGRGTHNKSKKQILKEEIKSYLTLRNIKNDEVEGNDGALYVYE